SRCADGCAPGAAADFRAPPSGPSPWTRSAAPRYRTTPCAYGNSERERKSARLRHQSPQRSACSARGLPANCVLREASPRTLLGLTGLLVTIPRRRPDLERVDEPPRRFRHFVDGAVECRFVSSRRMGAAAQLA